MFAPLAGIEGHTVNGASDMNMREGERKMLVVAQPLIFGSR